MLYFQSNAGRSPAVRVSRSLSCLWLLAGFLLLWLSAAPSVSAAGSPGFVVGINLGGSAVTIDGNAWLSHAEAASRGLVTSGASAWSYSTTLSPTPDAATQQMLSTGLWRAAPPNGQGFSLAYPLPNGSYQVYLWTVENYRSSYRDVEARLEGAATATGIGELPLGSYRRCGPYAATVADGRLDLEILRHTKGDPLLCGLEVCGEAGSNAPPTVTLTAPADGAQLTQFDTVALTATAEDADGGVSDVAFYQGSTLLGAGRTLNGSTFFFDWPRVQAGEYTLTARATDSAGAVTTSAPVRITVKTGTLPPIVRLTAPADGTEYSAGQTVTLEAEACDQYQDRVGIERVEFLKDGSLLGSDTTLPYTCDWANIPAGTAVLTARATDRTGAVAVSDPVTVEVGGASSGFVVGINLSGNAVTVGGNAWLSHAQAVSRGLTTTSASTWSYSIPLSPTPDADTHHALSTGLWRSAPPNGQGFSLAYPLANGEYQLYLWMVENYQSSYRAVEARVEGVLAAAGLGELAYGTYRRCGPYPAAIRDGRLDLEILRTTKGDPLLCGLELFGGIGGGGSPNMPPTVTLTSPTSGATFAAGATLPLAAAAADADGSVARVEFYRGTTLIGSDTTSPYALDWFNVQAGTYTLTARAVENLGAETASAPVVVTVQAPSSGTFVRGINLNGNGVTVDGSAWLSHSQALGSGLTVTGASPFTYSVPLTPTATADEAHLLGTGFWRSNPANGQGFSLAQSLPSGEYHVYLWMVENYRSGYRDATVRLEGQEKARGIGDLPLGAWRRYGPYNTTVADGALSLEILRTTKGDPLLCGLAIFSGHGTEEEPVPTPTGSRVMPLGDSITYGVYTAGDFGTGGYRRLLWQQLTAAGWSPDFVGTQASGLADFDRDHEGHNGWTIEHLSGGVTSWLSAAQPDVILLTAGTNDLSGVSPEVAAGRMATLLDTIHAARPQAQVLLATLPRVVPGNFLIRDPQYVVDFNARLPALVNARAAAGQKVRLVDLYTRANLLDSDFADGVHPNASGYAKIAAVWYQELSALLPKP
ncbi:MAG: Ig-like domain-containing protein [Armatimonadota bacterium]